MASVAIHVALGVTAVRGGHPAGSPPPPRSDQANLVGDTIDVNEEGDQATAGDDSVAPTKANDFEMDTPSPPPKSNGPGLPPARAMARSKARPGATGAKSSEGKGEGGEAGVFGAVGERGAVDLATAFTRQFPQASSADPAWATVPLGAAGEADVTLMLDESGKLASVQVSPSAPAALKSGISGTVRLIRGRSFTAPSARTRLHVRATVSPDKVHDGLHGEVFAIGGSFIHGATPSSGEGSAFFALNIGRRIDIRVTAR